MQMLGDVLGGLVATMPVVNGKKTRVHIAKRGDDDVLVLHRLSVLGVRVEGHTIVLDWESAPARGVFQTFELGWTRHEKHRLHMFW